MQAEVWGEGVFAATMCGSDTARPPEKAASSASRLIRCGSIPVGKDVRIPPTTSPEITR
jgi:hypothetical protein